MTKLVAILFEHDVGWRLCNRELAMTRFHICAAAAGLFLAATLGGRSALSQETPVVIEICAQCHGEAGISTAPLTPNLAGQRQKYLLKQLRSFRDPGRESADGELLSDRSHPIMNAMTERLNDAELFRLAKYYSKLSCGPEASVKPLPMPEGADKCEVCHGGSRSNPFTDTPVLAGQKADYLLRQLDLMRKPERDLAERNKRRHRLSEIMLDDLDRDQLKDISAYFASLSCHIPE